MDEKLRWAIIGAGSIARSFAKGLSLSQTGVLVAVGSRDKSKADAFCSEFGGVGYGSYEEAVTSEDVDAVYIALPHSGHAEWTMRCAQAGKHVLCEKPFTLDFASAYRAIEEVRKADVFFAEAFMYRFHPQTQFWKRLVAEGALGKISHVHAEFSFQVDEGWNNFRAVRSEGGGGLMDVGTYCVSGIRYVFGEEPIRCEYAHQPMGDGYDGTGAGLLVFEGGRTGTFSCGVHLKNRNRLVIYGSKGHIEVESPWICDGRTWVRMNGEDEVVHEKFETAHLYACEADTVFEFLAEREIPMMSIEDTLNNMKVLDALRQSSGLKFD